ncbi:MAG TPA: response regulator [Draconibacterium sp.]|nr:response regulator [Draconibacterium sp.]
MTKFKIEIQITFLAIIIGAVVSTIGYFSYKNLSSIVYSIHQEALPDNKLFLIKDIAAELTTLEHTLRLYVLTNNDEDLEQYNSHQRHIVLNLKKLNVYRGKFNPEAALIDSIGKFSMEKLKLWQEVLTIHLSTKSSKRAFSEIYSTLDRSKTDNLNAEILKKGFQSNLFGFQTTVTDTKSVVQSVEPDVIKKKIKRLESQLAKKGTQKNILESKLIEKNIILGKKINQLIAEAEAKASNDFLAKTKDADRMAAITYRWLALFTLTAVMLLMVALFVLFNYLRKARSYEQALTVARNKAEILARAKEQFAANMSHEIRTPVNAIYGLTEQVLQKNMDKETTEMVSVIFKSARHLKNIINDTLDFSKIQANKIKFKNVHFSPAELFEEVYSLQKYEAEKKGISIYFSWEGQKSNNLVGDPLRLKQIMINLISNAIKFTEKGQVAVKVTGSKKSDYRFELEIQITDTGIGMKESDLRVIFDEYVQIENQTGKKYSGTGLGLSIVKKLVDLQGGKINIESKPGEGTVVTVNITYQEGKQEQIEKTIKESFTIPETFKNLNVLIADDEDYNRLLIKSILQKWGVKFREARNGNEVIDAAQQELFDVILMDLNMPEMNGVEAAKAIVKHNSDITIVAITAHSHQIDRQACINAGMKGFVLKPFSEKDLFDTLISAIPVKTDSSSAILSQQINKDELMRLASGDKKFLAEMILLFIKSSEAGIANIDDAIKNENRESIFENAHKMAAPTKHIGAMQLNSHIKNLEKMALQNEPLEYISPVFEQIKREVFELNTYLKSQLVEIET